ncbi:MAG: hypothetical protein V1929_05145 [bacterium]
MIRSLAYRLLAGLNRHAKAALGVKTATVPPPHVAFDLDALGKPPAYTAATRSRSFLFVLQHVTRGSGGLADILHLGVELESQFGLDVRYMTIGGHTLDHCRSAIRWTNNRVHAEQVVDSYSGAPEYLCATAWPTAYEVLKRPSQRKLYFVQDYEPWFHRAGVHRHFAEQTYMLGFEILTLGPWLRDVLQERHGLTHAVAMPFPASDEADPGPVLADRNVVAFYVQPDKDHRGTELLLEAARRLSGPLRERGMDLVMYGSADNPYLALDFPCTVHGVLDHLEMVNLLRKTRVGVCCSFSNLSLLVMRYLTHGCITCDVQIPANRRNIPDAADPLLMLFKPTPRDLVDAVLRGVDHNIDEETRRKVAISVAREHAWPVSVRSIGALFTRSGTSRGDS